LLQLQYYLPQKSIVTNTNSTVLNKPADRKRIKNSVIIGGIVIIMVIAGIVYFLTNAGKSSPVIGEYKVVVNRAYFYNEPNEATRRNAYAVQGKATIKAYQEKDGFLYTEITNEVGQISKGWLRKRDLTPAESIVSQPPRPTAQPAVDLAVKAQLQTARQYITGNKLVQALIIYSTLSKQEVPEAMFNYGRLALQNKNNNITCKEAFDLISRASTQGYIPAKRVIGFLYTFAEDRALLEQSGYYQRCVFSQDIPHGTQLLMEAMLSGDTAASALIDRLKDVTK
jgi:TPR repeat protein